MLKKILRRRIFIKISEDIDFTDKRIARFNCKECRYCCKSTGRCERANYTLIRHLQTCPLPESERDPLIYDEDGKREQTLRPIRNGFIEEVDLRK